MSNHIPFIHNYCDRWCERCTMTSRCAIYVPNEKSPFEETTDEENEELWKSVGENLTKAAELISKEIEKRGIVITEEDNAKAAKELEDKMEFTDNHDLAKLSEHYWKEARPILEEINLVAFGEKSIQEVELGIKEEKQQHKLFKEVELNLEILHFYLFFINVKCRRALSGLLDILVYGEEEEEFDIPNDMLGSAKIALITTRRSIGAWALMMEHNIFPEEKTLPLLAILQRTESMILKYFPKAEVYKRPGFDE
ncbi:MAG: hypothetical protein ACI86M_002827 [Saprospiraceae bacterium]|jgi:hypothetical protein